MESASLSPLTGVTVPCSDPATMVLQSWGQIGNHCWEVAGSRNGLKKGWHLHEGVTIFFGHTSHKALVDLTQGNLIAIGGTHEKKNEE
ncbi:hypothetical protein DSO57_1026556 [Entomophthora muscae]|uniref:Uncharacterized protein n=1 Tax=Entomophthora muscae TaxID=34485 RepID=A0ACC2SR43_9FUNG|nr:hypothetical protein DSO57_1026556 [Entomophthora muscae]